MVCRAFLQMEVRFCHFKLQLVLIGLWVKLLLGLQLRLDAHNGTDADEDKYQLSLTDPRDKIAL